MRLFHLTLVVLVLCPMASSATESVLSGSWKSTPEELPLSSAFDESVWGKNAKSVRTVEMMVQTSGEASLSVTRKVVDARGRTVPASVSIEQASLLIGDVQNTKDVRSDLAVMVKSAERRYPDDPKSTWKLEGLRVGLATFSDKPNVLEVRVEMPEGTGSFWETLRRGAAKPAAKPSPSTNSNKGQRP